LTARELFSKTDKEILDYINTHNRYNGFGLDIVIADLNGRILKKKDLILVGRDFCVVFYRYDKTSHIGIAIRFKPDGRIIVEKNQFEYITGKIIDHKRIV
jgi:hypothetical protein